MYCRYCGDEIGASRLLTDTAFCCDAHRECRSVVPERTKSGGLPAPSLALPGPQSALSHRPKPISRSPKKLTKSGTLYATMSPALTALAADPPPPANAMLLAAVAAERAAHPRRARRHFLGRPPPRGFRSGPDAPTVSRSALHAPSWPPFGFWPGFLRLSVRFGLP